MGIGIRPEQGPGIFAAQLPSKKTSKEIGCRGETVNSVAQSVISASSANVYEWQHTKFNWAYRNPFATALKKGNDYVEEQWSTEYFTSCKDAVGLAKQLLCDMAVSLKSGDGAKFGKQTLDLLVILSKLAVNVELGNFIKGLIGVLLSSGKAVFHSIEALCHLLAAFALLIVLHPKEGRDQLFLALESFGYIFKDLVTAITSAGHAIPSWLPLAIMVICPPAGLGLILVKGASKFTGVFDVVAYGGTASLLYSKVVIARKTLVDESASEDAKTRAREVVKEWEKLKKDLNPTKSYEAAALFGYLTHVVGAAATTVLDAFVPSASTIAEYASYGIQALIGAMLVREVYQNQKAQQKEATGALSAPDLSQDQILSTVST